MILLNEVQQKHNNLDVRGVYFGIDASLTCTGLAVLNEEYLTTWNLKPKEKGNLRLSWFNYEFRDLLRNELKNITCCGLEGYAFGRHNKAHQIGELGGIIRLNLHDNNVSNVVIPPTSLKKFVTGSGKGDKSGMILHLYKRWGFTVEQEDQADATACALFAWYHYAKDWPMDITKAQQEVLEKLS